MRTLGDTASLAHRQRERAPLYAARSARDGLGVFAGTDIPRGRIVERCPVLVLSSRHAPALEQAGLHGYLYEWDGQLAVALGMGSLYNHSQSPNATYEAHLDDRLLVVRAARSIAAGEEITIDYVAAGQRDDLWFEPID